MKTINSLLMAICIVASCIQAEAQTLTAETVTSNVYDYFTYDNQQMPHYSLKWALDSWMPGGNTTWMSGFGGIKFFTNGVPRMAMDILGNVGIGTTSVNNDQGWGRVLDIYNNDHSKLLVRNHQVKTGIFSIDSWNTNLVAGRIGTESNHPLILMAGYGNDAVTINTDGNVGIGTSQPENSEHWQKALEVFGSIHSKIMAGTDNIKTGLFSHDNTGYYGAPAGGIAGTATNHPFSIMTNKATRMTVSKDGNVGIGTTTPTEKLCVDGNIKTRKVIVTQTNWPDYVFDSSYKLPSLNYVSDYIKENKRLPEMASATEVEKNGCDLGDIVKQQQKKIEELMLYMIEQNKKIAEQQKRLELLEKTR